MIEDQKLREPDVPHRARLEMGHALGEWAADRLGVRLLHIKGLAAEAVLPVGRGLSADVDLLVEPARYREYVALLQSLATTQVVDDAGRSSEAHAIEIVSHGLSVSLDVHGHFPGYRADPATVFDVLHRRSVPVSFGGWECACLDRVGLAVLGVVHAARNPPGSRSGRMALHRWDLLDDDEQTEALELIVELQAQGAASTVIGYHAKASRRDIALFLAHQRRARPATLWLLTLISTRGLRGRLNVLRRALSARSGLVDKVSSSAARTPATGGRLRQGVRGLRPAMRESWTLLKEARRDD